MGENINLNISEATMTYNINLPYERDFENISTISYMTYKLLSVTNKPYSTVFIKTPVYAESITFQNNGLQVNQSIFDYRKWEYYPPSLTIIFRVRDSKDRFSFRWSYLDSEKNTINFDLPPLFTKNNENRERNSS